MSGDAETLADALWHANANPGHGWAQMASAILASDWYADCIAAAEAKGAADALRAAAEPMEIVRWAEGPLHRGMKVAAVNRYLVERAAALAHPSTDPDG